MGNMIFGQRSAYMKSHAVLYIHGLAPPNGLPIGEAWPGLASSPASKDYDQGPTRKQVTAVVKTEDTGLGGCHISSAVERTGQLPLIER
jgi:hypothetical protein